MRAAQNLGRFNHRALTVSGDEGVQFGQLGPQA